MKKSVDVLKIVKETNRKNYLLSNPVTLSTYDALIKKGLNENEALNIEAKLVDLIGQKIENKQLDFSSVVTFMNQGLGFSGKFEVLNFLALVPLCKPNSQIAEFENLKLIPYLGAWDIWSPMG